MQNISCPKTAFRVQCKWNFVILRISTFNQHSFTICYSTLNHLCGICSCITFISCGWSVLGTHKFSSEDFFWELLKSWPVTLIFTNSYADPISCANYLNFNKILSRNRLVCSNCKQIVENHLKNAGIDSLFWRKKRKKWKIVGL